MSEYGNRRVMCVPSALQIEDVRKLIAESKKNQLQTGETLSM